MPQFSLTQMFVRPSDEGTSRITDLTFGTGALSDVLYSTTRFDGQIDSWDVTDAGLIPLDSLDFATGPVAGNHPTLTFVDGMLLSGGGPSGSLTLHSLGADGSIGEGHVIAGTTDFPAPLVEPVVVEHANDTTSIYAGFSGERHIAQINIENDGTLIETTQINDFGRTAADNITAMATSTIAGTTFVFTASATDLGITAWQVRDDTGAVFVRDTLRPETGLNVASPTVILPIVVAGQDYVVLAAAGSSSLTLISTSSLGELTIADHVIDDRNTRFDGVTALASTTYQGQTWVFAGGTDDGITAFQVLEGGRLLARAHVEDTPDMTLANIAALEARGDDTGIDIFAASSTEAGLTRLRLTISADDQVILDTPGNDTLTGGAGADVFVFLADDEVDTISDFEVGIDTLDLSDWAGLRSSDQLFFTPLSDGIEITYGDEALVLHSADGSTISQSDLSETDLIAPARISLEITSGTPGPVTPTPDLPTLPDLPPPTPELVDLITPFEQYGTVNTDTLTGSDGNDLIYGVDGNDRLSGGQGADLVFGGHGADQLAGGNGDDFLFGGEGRDGAWRNPTHPTGSTEADTLVGGSGDDELYGQAGHDWLDGGDGDDLLSGGAGRDTFVFRSGQDQVTDFNPVTDRIALDDALWAESLTADQIVDRFATDTGSDIVLDFGNDTTLRLDGFDDLDLLAHQIDIL